MSVPMKDVEGFSEELTKMGFAVTYWDRITKYTTDALTYCDIMIIILPNMSFNIQRSMLTRGCGSEIKEAIHLQKDIVLGYKTNEGKYKFYDVDIDPVRIRGIAASSPLKLYKQVHNILDKKLPTFVTTSLPEKDIVWHYDERLLLFYKS